MVLRCGRAIDELSYRAGRLPPDAAAALAAPYYAAPSPLPNSAGALAQAAVISEASRVAQQRGRPLGAACTATRLWGALALREMKLRDLPSTIVQQRFGNSTKEYLEQQTVRRRGVARRGRGGALEPWLLNV